MRPETKDALKDYVKVFCGIDVPEGHVCAGHNSPMDYLCHSFFGDFSHAKRASADVVVCTFCDPSGAARNDIIGTSAVRVLRDHGIRVRYRRSEISEGIELIRRALKAGDGTVRLIMSSRCGRLIEALRCYHYPDDMKKQGSKLPVKDGVYDHPIDALRYFFVNYFRESKAGMRLYQDLR